MPSTSTRGDVVGVKCSAMPFMSSNAAWNSHRRGAKAGRSFAAAHLSPLAGRGRMRREADHPGEGAPPRAMTPRGTTPRAITRRGTTRREAPSPGLLRNPTSPRKRGEVRLGLATGVGALSRSISRRSIRQVVAEQAFAGDHRGDHALAAHDVLAHRGVDVDDDEHHDRPHAEMMQRVHVLAVREDREHEAEQPCTASCRCRGLRNTAPCRCTS